MERIELEVYSRSANMAVVRLPGRRWPGSVVQGDSLRHLCYLAESILERIRDDHDRELCDDAEELVELLTDRLREYDQATHTFVGAGPTAATPPHA
jgi:hypothetical protein